MLRLDMPDAGPNTICRRMSEDPLFKSWGHTYDSIRTLVLKEAKKPHIALGIMAESTQHLLRLRESVMSSEDPDKDRLIGRIDEAIRAGWPEGYPQQKSSKNEGQN